jgi:hypothetical protein
MSIIMYTPTLPYTLLEVLLVLNVMLILNFVFVLRAHAVVALCSQAGTHQNSQWKSN